MADNFILDLIGALQQAKTKKQINSDIKQLEKSINMLRLTATFSKKDTKSELNAYIKILENQLSQVKLKAKIDGKNLKSEVDKALNNVSYKDIDLMDIDENKVKLKARKVIADVKSIAEKSSISINIDMKKEKLSNDLTAYLNKNTKIKESSTLLEEADKLKDLIDSIDDPKSLKEATTAFQLYKSEVSATGFAAKSTTDKIKGMLSHVTKIASLFGVASLAVSSFRKSLQTLKEVDTYLTEISKANDKLSKSQLAQIGNDSFAIASKYGKQSTNYLSAVQEMSRAGYEDAAGLSELSVAAQGAGDMTQELANRYIIATDKAYKLGGSVEKLTEVLDGSNYITNHNAVNMTELSEAMSIVGSTTASFGVDVDQATAALGTMIATTQQSGSEVARAFRAILLNIRQVSDEEEGIDAEGLTKYEAACNALNVSLKETKNGITSLRDPMQVLKELSEAYNKLEESDIRRTNLLTSVGGKLRSTQLDALLRQWDTYEKMLKEYAEGTGSMAIEAEKTAKSFEGRLNALQNSWDSFVNSLTNKDMIMGGISFFDRLIQGAEGLTNAIGEIPVLITSINGAMTAMNKDYGITQLFSKETGKFDIQGNIFGIDFSAIKAQKKHFAEAEKAISYWNKELKVGNTDLEAFNSSVVKNNAQLKQYLSTCSTDAPASLNGYKSYLVEAGVSTDALRLKTVLLNAAISMGIGIAIQAAVQGLTKLINATKEARQRALELGAEFTSAKSGIEGYKEQIEELYKTINDSSSSIEDVTNARKTLMSVQDEMIDKFGNEKSVIDDVTAAINGQTEALDRLTQAKWQEAKNEFNDGDFWNDTVNFLQGTDNIQRMLDEYSEKTITFKWADYADITDLTDEMVSELENIGVDIKVSTDNLQAIRDFDSLTESITDTNGAMLSVTGNAEEIYNQLLALQNLIGNDDSFNKLYDRIEDTANSYKDLTDLYKEFYDQYILYEKILTDGSDYADAFKAITDAYEEYTDAFTSGDEDKIKEATEKYASVISNAMENALANGDSDVATYFENMYPTLQSVVSGWKFNVAFDTNTDDLQTKVQSVLDELKDENDRQFTTEEILDLGSENEQYRDLISIAHSYNMTLEEMIALLRERNMVADMDYQSLVSLFGQENVDSLTPEDIEIAYTIKNVGNMTFEQLIAEIQRVKDEAANSDKPFLFSQLTKSKESIDRFQTSCQSAAEAYSTLLSGNYSSSELLESIQTINKAINDMNGTLDWEQISSLDELQGKLEDISMTYANSILAGTGIDVDSEFGRMLSNIVQEMFEAEAEFEAMNSQLDNLQSSYQTLTSVLESYNETGYISLDNLQSLLTADENLIQMLEVENGQLVLNQEAYENLVAVQLLEFKTKLNDAAAAEIETLAKQKAEQATNSNAQASENAVAKLDAETAAFNRNTSAAIANAVAKAEESGVSEAEIQGVFDKYTEVWNSALKNYNVDFDSFMGGGKKAAGKAGRDAGKEYASKFEEALNDLKSALSGITSLINKQINAYSDSKDAAVSSLKEELNARVSVIEAQKEQLNNQVKLIDAQIKAKQKIIENVRAEIQAMKDANDQRQRELALQDALFRQKLAENQRSKLVYNSEKGFTYETDTDAIRSAKEDVDQAKFDIAVAEKEKQISLVEKEIDLLESKKDLLNEQIDLLDAQISQVTDYYDKLIAETENYWDSLIKSMEEYRNRWTELSEIEDQAKLISQLKELGITTDDITNMSAEAFEKFKDRYLVALLKVNEGNADVQNSIAELGGSAGSIQPVSDAIDNASSSMDNLSGSASTAGQSVSNTASNLDTAATSAGNLKDSLTDVSTAISDEQTAFSNLKQTINEVIETINDKITAIQEEQRTVGIATSSEMADFLLLRDKILEVKESIDEVSTTVTDLDAQTLDNITNSFQQLYDEIILVSGALGSGIEGSGEGVTNSIASAILALNDISLEDGIIAQFNNLKTAIDEVTTAISGGGGESSGSQSQGGQSGSGSSGSGGQGAQDGAANSLSGAITEMGETAKTVIGEPDAEGDSTVIGEFGSLETAVNDVTEAIGIGGEEGSGGSGGGQGGDDGTLIGSITTLGETTEDTLGESGGDGVIGRFEQFKDVIGEANEHVHSISDGLNDIDGQEVECTIKVNIETTGGLPGGLGFATGTALDTMNLNSSEYTAKLGAAHAEGTALVSGNWAVQSDEKSALMGEIGYEIIVRNGRFFTVGENGAEMVPIKKGDIVFNHEQSKNLLENGHISGRGKAYADGTVGDKFASGVLRTLQPGDRMYDLIKKANDYFARTGEDIHDLLSPVNTIRRDMDQMANAVNTINNINNSNRTQQIVNQEFHISLPNVNDSTAATELLKDLQSISLKKLQFFD